MMETIILKWLAESCPNPPAVNYERAEESCPNPPAVDYERAEEAGKHLLVLEKD
jgi:hypothetical protein